MIGFGSNWYQMRGWRLAWRWQIVGFGSNWMDVSKDVAYARIW